jgi:hypothetical protein
MAEVIAVMSSIIAIIQISDRVIELVKIYIESSTDAPSDLRTILVEISTVKSLLKSLEYLHQYDHTTPALWSQIAGPNGPVEGCRQSITELEKLFPSDSVKMPVHHDRVTNSRKHKVKRMLTTLAWPLKANKARGLLQKIVQHKVTINLALASESL